MILQSVIAWKSKNSLLEAENPEMTGVEQKTP